MKPSILLLAVFCMLFGLTPDAKAQRHSSAVMQVTARVLPAPDRMEWQLYDSISVDPEGRHSWLGRLTMPGKDTAGYLLQFSRESELHSEEGLPLQGELRSREMANSDGSVSYELVGDFNGEGVNSRVSAGKITATVEYY